jgi:hypothetical protein
MMNTAAIGEFVLSRNGPEVFFPHLIVGGEESQFN